MRTRARATTQMQASAQAPGQPGISGNDQGNPPPTAESGDGCGQSRAGGVSIMPQQHAGQTRWQGADNRKWVRQPLIIGKKPERRGVLVATTLTLALYPAGPGD